MLNKFLMILEDAINDGSVIVKAPLFDKTFTSDNRRSFIDWMVSKSEVYVVVEQITGLKLLLPTMRESESIELLRVSGYFIKDCKFLAVDPDQVNQLSQS